MIWSLQIQLCLTYEQQESGALQILQCWTYEQQESGALQIQFVSEYILSQFNNYSTS